MMRRMTTFNVSACGRANSAKRASELTQHQKFQDVIHVVASQVNERVDEHCEEEERSEKQSACEAQYPKPAEEKRRRWLTTLPPPPSATCRDFHKPQAAALRSPLHVLMPIARQIAGV